MTGGRYGMRNEWGLKECAGGPRPSGGPREVFKWGGGGDFYLLT